MMPYVLSVIGVAGMLAIGAGRWWGWLIALVNECLWLVFAVLTKQYGFIIGAAVYGTVNTYNAFRWKQNHTILRVMR
jgi:nicotinamide riboside transporter PnuC